jgi:hypothetical protein
MRALRTLAYVLALPLAACAVEDAEVARVAQSRLVGLSEVDLLSCLGLPAKSQRLGNVEIKTYERAPASSGGLSLTLPVIGGGVNVTGGGYCSATFKLVDGAVAAVHYTGDNDVLLGDNAFCAPIVQDCLKSIDPKVAEPQRWQQMSLRDPNGP